MARETRESKQGTGTRSPGRANGAAKAPPPLDAKAQARRRANARRKLERERSAVARDELDRIVEVYGRPEWPLPRLPHAQPSTALDEARRHVREDLSILRHGSRTLFNAAIDLGRTPRRLWGALRLWRAERAIREAQADAAER